MQRILRYGRHKLLSVIRDSLKARFRFRLDDGEVEVVGVFFVARHDWYLGVRVRDGRRLLYLRVREQTRGVGYSMTVHSSFEGFDWLKYDPDLYEGDNNPAYRRLKGKHERKRNQNQQAHAIGAVNPERQ